MWTSIINALTENYRFVISSHLNPDCDALGSELALAHLLLKQGKEVAILNTDPLPPVYQFLDPENLIQTFSENKHLDIISQADVIIVVDVSGGWKRLGRLGDALSQIQATTICIDHHPNGEPFTEMSFIDTEAAATGELIFDLITAMQEEITPSIAEALYAAIITDTGNFRFSKTSARTHLIAATLLECGVDFVGIYNLLYEQYPLSRLQLKGHVLQKINLTADGQIAYAGLSLEELEAFNCSPSGLDGFSSLAQQIKGVKISIFLIELSRGRVKISLRSNGEVPVNELAARFGGGGHIPAAGATIQGNLNEVMEKVIIEAKKLLC
jgi:phosphoesterase RecJ-like protein